MASLYVSHRNHFITLRSSLFSDRKLLFALDFYNILLKFTFEPCTDAVNCDCHTGSDFFGIVKFCRPTGVIGAGRD